MPSKDEWGFRLLWGFVRCLFKRLGKLGGRKVHLGVFVDWIRSCASVRSLTAASAHAYIGNL